MAKKWLDSTEKQKRRSNLKFVTDRHPDRGTSGQTDKSQLLTIMTLRLGTEINKLTYMICGLKLHGKKIRGKQTSCNSMISQSLSASMLRVWQQEGYQSCKNYYHINSQRFIVRDWPNLEWLQKNGLAN